MSFGDLYTVPPGQGNAPDLPPIDLPRTAAPPRRPLQITIGGKTPEADPWAASGVTLKSADEHVKTAAEPSGDSWEGSGVKFKSADEHVETATQPHRPVGTGEAFGRSAAQGATFGLYPAIAGAMSAGRSPEEQAASAKAYESGQPPSALSELHDLIKGLGRLGLHHVIAPALGIETGRETPESYTKGREEAQKALEAGREQHPYASFAGELAGAAAIPVPGLAAAATPARIARGATFGGAGGAAYGAGSALSEGKDAGGIAKGAALGGTLGAVTGGLFGGIFGPRAPTQAMTRGERAAEFAAKTLKAPIPRGLASDNTAINSATAAARSFPILGAKIGTAVDKAQHAAGEHIGDIAVGMVGAKPSRAVADVLVRPGLQEVIDKNKAVINAGYDAVRNAIDQSKKWTMPRTKAALASVIQKRANSGDANPRAGLDELINISNGANFDGAHMRRALARAEGKKPNPHPGYEKGQFNHITKAMTADIRDILAASTKSVGGRPVTAAQQQATVHAFDSIEKKFGPLADENDRLASLIDSWGQAPIEKLMGAASERGGDLKLLNQLRNTMTPSDFHVIGGTLLHELGHNNATSEFSLSKFATNFDKLSDGAKSILFSPKHAKDIEDIAGLGNQMKRALRDSNTSHTSNVIILFELAKDAIIFAAAGGFAHLMNAEALAGVAAATPAVLFTRWLSNPAKASSMAAWSRARVGMLGHPTPARLAAFNIASRNLANNLGVPIESVMKRLAAPAGSRAEDDQPEGRDQVPR